MNPFIYNAQPGRVIFGTGSFLQIRDEATSMGMSRVLVLCTQQQRNLADQAVEYLGELAVGIHDKAVMHVPVESAQDGVARAREMDADACLAVGGGSTIGLGKAIALETGLPLIVVATTYSGSEMTPIWGLTENGVKKTGRDPRVLPRAVIYDPQLTIGLPVGISAASGMNAIAHAVEALYAENANPVISLMAEEGIRALAESLPRVVASPSDIDARGMALYGSWLCGTCLGSVGMALHHKLCHTLGGSFDLPHAEVHTVIIPHATAYNRDAAPEAMMRIARALNAGEAALGLYELAQSIGAPISLQAIGMREADINKTADIASRNPYYNPKPVTRDGIRALLENAYKGLSPSVSSIKD
ncbi:MAG: maleylacetate reductase [Candidatus Thiodiazotropha endolucinida]